MRPDESFVTQPVRSLQTMLRVLSKDDPRISTVIPDGIYGPGTTQSVSAFQRVYGIPANGVTDQGTWDAIVIAYEEAIIRQGAAQPIEALIPANAEYGRDYSGPYVYLLQAMLMQLSADYASIDEPPVTGTIDSQTVSSIRQFQQLAGLEPSGIFDRKTWKHLVLHFEMNAHKNQRSLR